MIKVGLPRALIYYQHYAMWRTFFEELGAETVASPKTSRAIMTEGAKHVVAETCLPAKLYCGHCAALGNQVDYIFIPSVKSIEPQVYNCSKFVGLPDLVRHTGKDLPPIVDIEIDVNRGMRKVREEIHSVGKRFTRLPWKIDAALDRALAADREYQGMMRQGLTPPEALVKLYPDQAYELPPVKISSTVTSTRRPLVIALVGHPYNIHDEYINHSLVARLRGMNVKLVTPEMVSVEALTQGIARLSGKPYFTYEREVVGAGGHYIHTDVDGIICVVAFACGPDSMMVDVVTRGARKAGKPIMMLAIDEHTGEAGLVTRLEAFVDMLQRRLVLSERLERNKLQSARISGG